MKKIQKLSAFMLTLALILSVCSGLFVFSAKEINSYDQDANVRITNYPETTVTGTYTLNYNIEMGIGVWEGSTIKTLKVTYEGKNGTTTTTNIYAAAGKGSFSGSYDVTCDGKLTFDIVSYSGKTPKVSFDINIYNTPASNDKTAPVVKVTQFSQTIGSLSGAWLAINVTDPNGIKTFTVNGVNQLNSYYTSAPTDVTVPYDAKEGMLTIKATDIYGNASESWALVQNGVLYTSGTGTTNPSQPSTPVVPDYSKYIIYSKEIKTESLTAEQAVLRAPSATAYYPLVSFYLTYQWQVLVGASYINIPGETGETLTIANPEEGASYRVAVSDLLNSYFYYSTAVYLRNIPAPVPEVTPEPDPEPQPEPEPEFTVDDITVSGIPTSEVTVGDMLILIPSPLDGTWTFDSKYLTGLNEGITVLKAESAGVTVLKYRVIRDGEIFEKSFVITIKPSEEPEKVPEVPTFDD